MVGDRDSKTVLSIIEKRVAGGTTIFSDGWSSYSNIKGLGYSHYQVNHKKHFVEVQDEIQTPEEMEVNIRNELRLIEERDDFAEDTSDQEPTHLVFANTQKIERAWREVKRGLQGQPLCLLRRNLSVEMFRFNSMPSSLSFEEKRDVVLRVVGKHQAELDKLNQTSFSIYADN